MVGVDGDLVSLPGRTEFLDHLADPVAAMPSDHPHRPEAVRLHAQGSWRLLADLYQQQSEVAWREHRPALALRLLLAESRVALRTGDRQRFGETLLILGQRHRLNGGPTAAEVWNLVLLREPLGADTARFHAHAWRELAALREVTRRYDEGLSCCERALAVCRRYPDAPGVAGRHVRALMQTATIRRLRGELVTARDLLREARELAEARDVDAFTRGLVALREGGLEIVLGRPEVALTAYRRAATAFERVSENNFLYTRLREVAALRELGRFDDALRITDDLADRFRARGDAYRLGQVLLERAEVLQSRGDMAAVAATLKETRSYYEGADTLEALRWHRHVARALIVSGGDGATAARHLAVVLDRAGRPGGRDLNRTMLALHDLHRIPETDVLSPSLRHAAGRGALLAADLQRDSLHEPGVRWANHAHREEVYQAAVLAHTVLDDPESTVRVAETGRADLLNQLLVTRSGGAVGTIAESRIDAPPGDPGLADEVFAVARLAAGAIRSGRAPDRLAVPPLPGRLPSPAALDTMADVVVVVNLGRGPDGWWSSVLTRPRHGAWRAALRTASTELAARLDILVAGVQLPPRGVSRAVWAELGAFLLPDPAVWAGTPERPRSVAITPDPRLWHLPHAALIRDGRYLCDVAEVSLTPSLRTLELLLARTVSTGPGRTPGGPAVSLLDRGLGGHRVERAALDDWPGDHRTVARLPQVDEVVDPALLYVSGHGDRAGADTRLGPDGVTMDALAPRRLPPLVVLNGCWSGTASSRYGYDPLSLAVGALLGGADTVVAGVGRIGSVASAHVGASLVRQVGRGVPVITALRHAQREIRTEHPDLGPFEWAGLCGVGAGR
ncbi:CHAT domain-containing protein [Micromonospora sp. NBRC 101691]|uniref:CHAT domain-containing protein n=1 Tax=Micromonospora sp. NBRC 101691 TaxID=3032198 RepID=UPI002553A5FF|nr:CHAT domain-containing protein [Micromonospora sp. NBRC 101691]